MREPVLEPAAQEIADATAKPRCCTGYDRGARAACVVAAPWRADPRSVAEAIWRRNSPAWSPKAFAAAGEVIHPRTWRNDEHLDRR